MKSSAQKNWIVRAPGTVERIEACFTGRPFAPHRHDTYAIGVTLSGVQSFRYRGTTWSSLPGQLVVLHPDELHDGYAGDDRAFRYRTVYLAPADIQRVLGGRALPFVEACISRDPQLHAAVCSLLDDYERPMDEFAWEDSLFDVVTALERVSGARRNPGVANRAAAHMARSCIDARLGEPVSLGELERVTGHDRWQLSRDFRAIFGTSPYRYLVLRRLDNARALMLAGSSATQAAYASGFADQSHFGRQFKQAFGMTPRAWLGAASHDRSRLRFPPRAN